MKTQMKASATAMALAVLAVMAAIPRIAIAQEAVPNEVAPVIFQE